MKNKKLILRDKAFKKANKRSKKIIIASHNKEKAEYEVFIFIDGVQYRVILTEINIVNYD